MIMKWTIAALLLLGLGVAGCSGKDETAAADADSPPKAVEETTPNPSGELEEPAEAASRDAAEGESSGPTTEPDDPNAFYGIDDIPEEGGYIKLDLVDLEPRVLNRVLHRFRTEPATCEGCEGYTLHDILVFSPDCMPCLHRSREIIAEESARN